MIANRDRLVILDADGTLVDAFQAVGLAFARHDMDLGDQERFQKRRKLFKYLGGLREFPTNLRQQFGKRRRKDLIHTLTDIYRGEARLYPGMTELLHALIEAPHVHVGIITRNVTHEPLTSIGQLLRRHGVDIQRLDFVRCIPWRDEKIGHFRQLRSYYAINPARAYACGDEHRDYAAAIGCGMHPFVAAYGFEDFDRLRSDYGIPEEVISRTSRELAARLCHALDLELPVGSPSDGRPAAAAAASIG